MESVIRGFAVYFLLLVVFRLAGRRTLAQTTNFDLVLLLIISETTQQAMVNGDHSITNGVLLILTLVGLTILLSFLKMRFPWLDKIIEGTPVIIVRHGKVIQECLDKMHVDEQDILSAARQLQGLERMDQIKYAIVERNGDITIVPA